MATAKEKRLAREQTLRDEGAADALAKLNTDSAMNAAAVTDAHGSVAQPQSAGQKVVVACKLGVPYFDIQHCQIEEKFEQNLQGGRMIKEGSRTGSVVRLRGTSYPRGTPPAGFPERPEIVGGAAMNPGIDKDWFDEWLKQNRLNPLVVNRMIFAAETYDGARGAAKDLSSFLSGLEPVNPARDSRIPRSTREEVSDVETEDQRKKKQQIAAAAG